jgi:hypothetical protein
MIARLFALVVFVGLTAAGLVILAWAWSEEPQVGLAPLANPQLHVGVSGMIWLLVDAALRLRWRHGQEAPW